MVGLAVRSLRRRQEAAPSRPVEEPPRPPAASAPQCACCKVSGPSWNRTPGGGPAPARSRHCRSDLRPRLWSKRRHELSGRMEFDVFVVSFVFALSLCFLRPLFFELGCSPVLAALLFTRVACALCLFRARRFFERNPAVNEEMSFADSSPQFPPGAARSARLGFCCDGPTGCRVAVAMGRRVRFSQALCSSWLSVLLLNRVGGRLDSGHLSVALGASPAASETRFSFPTPLRTVRCDHSPVAHVQQVLSATGCAIKRFWR